MVARDWAIASAATARAVRGRRSEEILPLVASILVPAIADELTIEHGTMAAALSDGGSRLCVPIGEARTLVLVTKSIPYDDDDLASAEVLAAWVSVALAAAARADQAPAEACGRDAVAAVAHDLVNPVTVILANAQALRRSSELASAAARVAVIERAAQRMNRIVRDLLDEVRCATVRVSIELGWHRVGDILNEVAEALRGGASGRRIRLVVESVERIVLCDRARIVQVLVNLVDNAIKHSRPGSRVWLRAALAQSRVQLEVRDEGAGIPEADLPRLFERYFRRGNGTGIGLTTARSLVAAHDGELQVTSVVGVGTSFFFDLHSAE